MTFPIVDLIKIVKNDTVNVLTLTAGDLSFSGELTFEQLSVLHNEISNLLDPKRFVRERIKELKNSNRESYMHYKKESDPEIKKQRLELYLEKKTLIEELERGTM